MTDWKDKNVGVLLRKGTSHKKKVTDERDGSVAGHHIEHWDGSQDAVAKVPTVKLKTRVERD